MTIIIVGLAIWLLRSIYIWEKVNTTPSGKWRVIEPSEEDFK